MDPIVKNLDPGDKSWTFLDGSKRSAAILGSVAIGLGHYLPGWRWSIHVHKQTGKTSEAHIGCILSGHMTIRSVDGSQVTVGPGDAFQVLPGHDAWVTGNEPCIALDFENRAC